jgi:hypothetical protein
MGFSAFASERLQTQKQIVEMARELTIRFE